jgi:hypothetical protein
MYGTFSSWAMVDSFLKNCPRCAYPLQYTKRSAITPEPWRRIYWTMVSSVPLYESARRAAFEGIEGGQQFFPSEADFFLVDGIAGQFGRQLAVRKSRKVDLALRRIASYYRLQFTVLSSWRPSGRSAVRRIIVMLIVSTVATPSSFEVRGQRFSMGAPPPAAPGSPARSTRSPT